MPFKSKSQRRLFYAMKERGEMDQATVDEFESETKSKLPEYKKIKKKLRRKKPTQ